MENACTITTRFAQHCVRISTAYLYVHDLNHSQSIPSDVHLLIYLVEN